MNVKKILLGILVFIMGAVVLALLETMNIKLGGIGGFIFMLAFLYILSKAIGWNIFGEKTKGER
jgi:hypothetical protein